MSIALKTLGIDEDTFRVVVAQVALNFYAITFQDAQALGDCALNQVEVAELELEQQKGADLFDTDREAVEFLVEQVAYTYWSAISDLRKATIASRVALAGLGHP